MSLFTLVLDFPREEIDLFPEEFLEFIQESPNVMRHYRNDESHYHEWRERQERLKTGQLEREVPALKFRFHFLDHAEALKRREQKRQGLDEETL